MEERTAREECEREKQLVGEEAERAAVKRLIVPSGSKPGDMVPRDFLSIRLSVAVWALQFLGVDDDSHTGFDFILKRLATVLANHFPDATVHSCKRNRQLTFCKDRVSVCC